MLAADARRYIHATAMVVWCGSVGTKKLICESGWYLRNGSDNLTFLKSLRNSIQYFREVIASAPAAPNKSFIAQCLILVLPPYSLLLRVG